MYHWRCAHFVPAILSLCWAWLPHGILIYSFAHLLIYSFTHLLIWSFDHLFIYSFAHLLIYSFDHLIIYSFTHLLICSFTHLIIWSFTHLLICSFAHLLIYSSACYVLTHGTPPWYSPLYFDPLFLSVSITNYKFQCKNAKSYLYQSPVTYQNCTTMEFTT